MAAARGVRPAAKAVAAGATLKKPVQDQFYGDRSGSLEDPFGHSWTFATHKEDVSPEEIGARAAKMFGGGQPCEGASKSSS